MLADDRRPVELLVSKFGLSLASVDLAGNCITDDLLRLMGAKCPLLESISLTNNDDLTDTTRTASDEGIINLLTSCSLLKSIWICGLPVTVAVLHAIVNARLLLTALRLASCPGIMTINKEWIRQQAKEHQLLPVSDICIGV